MSCIYLYRFGRLFLFFLLFLSACGGEEQPETLPATIPLAATPTLQPTQLAETAVPPVTAVPTLAPPNASFMGVQFAYDETWFGSQTAELLPPIPLQVGPEPGFPERIRFRFGETADEFINPRHPQILVYPVADYEAFLDQAAQKLAVLRILLQQQSPNTDTPIPLLPITNATEAFHTQPVYLGFQNGFGLRYLTLYAQGVIPIANDNVFYTFQGLTSDGKYYIAAFFPISTATLPATSNEVNPGLMETAESYATYLSGTVEVLNGLTSADFNPNLSALDAMMQSLLVTPDASFPSPDKQVGVAYEGIHFTYHSSLASDVTAEKLPTELEGLPDPYRFTFAVEPGAERPSTLLIQPIRDGNGDYYAPLPEEQQQYYNSLNEQLLAQADAGSVQGQMSYTGFANGTGVRYVTSLVNEPQPVTNQNLFYIFEGFTSDGVNYVRLEFAISSGLLPQSEELSQQAGSDYLPYLEGIIQSLNGLETADFAPDLAQLDELIHSLSVAPFVSIPQPVVDNPADCTNNLEYVEDITIPDNTRLTAGQTFTKIWQVFNSGTCTWDGRYSWVFVSGEQFQAAESISFPAIVAPGEIFDIGLDMTAPDASGTYQGWWQLQDPSGNLVGTEVYLLIEIP